MTIDPKISRRQFLAGAASASLPLLLAGGAAALPGRYPAAPGQEETTEQADLGGQDPTAQALLAEIRWGDSAARRRAVEQAPLAGTSALAPLAGVYGGGDPAAAQAAGEAIQRILRNAARPGARDEFRAARRALARLREEGQSRRVRMAARWWMAG